MFTSSFPPGVVGKLFKQESQLRGEIVSLITKKLRASPRLSESSHKTAADESSRGHIKERSQSNVLQEFRATHHTETRHRD